MTPGARAVAPKVGVLVVTHGASAPALLDAVRALLGAESAEGMEPLTVVPGEPKGALATRMGDAVGRLDVGAGVLVVCDLHGSTPSNAAVELKRAGRPVEVLCGLSLPMLVKLATLDRAGKQPGELTHPAAETALRSIRLGEGGTP